MRPEVEIMCLGGVQGLEFRTEKDLKLKCSTGLLHQIGVLGAIMMQLQKDKGIIQQFTIHACLRITQLQKGLGTQFHRAL